jgi:hypothetical protein
MGACEIPRLFGVSLRLCGDYQHLSDPGVQRVAIKRPERENEKHMLVEVHGRTTRRSSAGAHVPSRSREAGDGRRALCKRVRKGRERAAAHTVHGLGQPAALKRSEKKKKEIGKESYLPLSG